MKISVDGRGIEIEEGALLGDALRAAGSQPADGAIIGIIKGRGEKSRQTDSYWLNTTKGKIRIELSSGDLQKVWHESLGRIEGVEARWASADAVAFGPFSSALVSARDAHEYDRWEIVLGAAGFEAEKTHLIFVRKRHSAAYGVPQDGGVFAKIVGGKGILDRLERGDRILGIEPIVEWEALTENVATTDRSLPLAEGMEVFTRVDVDLTEDAPEGAEFFMALTRDGTFRVDAASSSYVSCNKLLGEPIDFEHREPRLSGSVSVRTSGRGHGRIFIYKADRTSNPGHSVVGRVTAGMDMIKLAGPGHLLTVRVSPERIMIMGAALKDALKVLSSRGIEAEVDGATGDEAVVVALDPGTTMAVLRGKKVRLTTIPSSRLISVELFDDQAPRTLDYFRHVTGLKERSVGPLPVFFVYENTLLFKPVVEATSYKDLLPENKPTGPVPAGSLGVSNSVAKKIGMVGVKLVDDRRYGPSGEKFEATNLIGRVLDPEKLRDVREGETVYVLEVRK